MDKGKLRIFFQTFSIGLAAGLFGGLVGLGGGVVMIPLMVSWLKLNQHKAHGTSLVALVFTGLAGALSYAQRGHVDFGAAMLLAAAATSTAGLGARFAHSLPEWGLKRTFGGFLLLVCLLLLARGRLPVLAFAPKSGLKTATLLSAGVFTGFLSGMMGVGGGSIMVPVMVLTAGFSQHAAQGSSLLAMVPAGTAGACTHWRLGNVALHLLPGIIPGILLGSYWGGCLAHLVNEEILRGIFAGVLIWIGIKYLRSKKA